MDANGNSSVRFIVTGDAGLLVLVIGATSFDFFAFFHRLETEPDPRLDSPKFLKSLIPNESSAIKNDIQDLRQLLLINLLSSGHEQSWPSIIRIDRVLTAVLH